MLLCLIRFTSLKDQSPLRPPVQDTSPPHRQSWSRAAQRTPQKHRRQPWFRTRRATAKDWLQTLTSGMFKRLKHFVSGTTARKKSGFYPNTHVHANTRSHTRTHTHTPAHTHTHTHTRDWDHKETRANAASYTHMRPFSGLLN